MLTDVTFKYKDSTGTEQEKVIPLTLKNSGTGDLTGHAELPEAYWSSDDAFTYTFKGWSEKQQPNKGVENTENDWKAYFQEDALQSIAGDRILYPVFEAVRKSYMVTFINPANAKENQEMDILYGSDAVYVGTPTKVGYEFTGWYPTPEKITGPTRCVAQFIAADQNRFNENGETSDDDNDTDKRYFH